MGLLQVGSPTLDGYGELASDRPLTYLMAIIRLFAVVNYREHPRPLQASSTIVSILVCSPYQLTRHKRIAKSTSYGKTPLKSRFAPQYPLCPSVYPHPLIYSSI